MTEAASQLNLELLTERQVDKLIPSRSKKPIFIRSPIYSGFIILSILLLFYRWILNSSVPVRDLVVLLVVVGAFVQKERVGKKYELTSEGLIVPYTWLTRKLIPYEDILQVQDDHITTGEKKQAAIRIFLDTPLLKFNTTGQSTSNILLSTLEYDSYDLNSFADELNAKIREFGGTENTLAQRLTDQVLTAWKNRWVLIILNLVDSLTETIYYLLILDIFLIGVLNYSIWVNPNGPSLGIVVLLIYALIVIILQLINKPQAILGIRPHELGAVIYDEEELLTNIRFLVICQPYTVDLLDCEVIYNQGKTTQVGRLRQMHPKSIPSGELTYVVAQFTGNHSKASGVKIQLQYQEKADSDIVYEQTIEWD